MEKKIFSGTFLDKNFLLSYTNNKHGHNSQQNEAFPNLSWTTSSQSDDPECEL